MPKRKVISAADTIREIEVDMLNECPYSFSKHPCPPSLASISNPFLKNGKEIIISSQALYALFLNIFFLQVQSPQNPPHW
jgi:hypothetical protein